MKVQRIFSKRCSETSEEGSLSQDRPSESLNVGATDERTELVQGVLACVSRLVCCRFVLMRKGVCSWDCPSISPLVLKLSDRRWRFLCMRFEKKHDEPASDLLLLTTEGCSKQNAISSAFHGLVAVHFVSPLMIAALDQ